jgi:hypothetical protein
VRDKEAIGKGDEDLRLTQLFRRNVWRRGIDGNIFAAYDQISVIDEIEIVARGSLHDFMGCLFRCLVELGWDGDEGALLPESAIARVVEFCTDDRMRRAVANPGGITTTTLIGELSERRF